MNKRLDYIMTHTIPLNDAKYKFDAILHKKKPWNHAKKKKCKGLCDNKIR